MLSAENTATSRNFTALEALICIRRIAERIAERTASCYMLLLLESILFGPELLSSRFLIRKLKYATSVDIKPTNIFAK
jgi:hypothetical protein